jgi:hypothetical protein
MQLAPAGAAFVGRLVGDGLEHRVGQAGLAAGGALSTSGERESGTESMPRTWHGSRVVREPRRLTSSWAGSP